MARKTDDAVKLRKASEEGVCHYLEEFPGVFAAAVLSLQQPRNRRMIKKKSRLARREKGGEA